MNNDLISVVVPCYNVEKYLEKCVESIVKQTYQNLEIIMVDDGAKDRTPELCDKLALTDSRIKVLHKVNGGLSDARNAGLAVANGKYITFFDSDDWIEPDTIKIAYKKMTANNLDLVVWGYTSDFVDDNENIIYNRLHFTSALCEKGINTSDLAKDNTLSLSGYAWNKLYKAEIIKNNNLLFEKGISLVEDILFNSLYICKCNKIEFIDYIGNHYIQRDIVTLGTKRYDNIFELKLLACEARKKILSHFEVEDKIFDKKMAYFYHGVINSVVTHIATEQGVSNKVLIEKMKIFLKNKDVQKLAKKAMKVPFKQRVLVILARLKMASVLVKLKR